MKRMKKVVMIGLTVLISVAFVTAVFAQAPAPEKKAKAQKFTGEVVKVDEAVIVVKTKMGEETFEIKDAKWVGYKDGKEVKAGDVVDVTAVDMQGKKVAKSVAKGKKPAAEKPAAAPEKAPAPAPAKPF